VTAPDRLPGKQLSQLRRELEQARMLVADDRLARRGPFETLDARRAVLAALEAYAEALEARRLPMPHALRDELRLHRQLFG